MLFEDLSWEEKNALRGKISERRKYQMKIRAKNVRGRVKSRERDSKASC